MNGFSMAAFELQLETVVDALDALLRACYSDDSSKYEWEQDVSACFSCLVIWSL
jgi:hypothetical protein